MSVLTLLQATRIDVRPPVEARSRRPAGALPPAATRPPEDATGRTASVSSAEESEAAPLRVDIEWSNGFTHHVYVLGSATTASGLFFLVDDPLFGLQQVRAWSLTRAYLGDGRCQYLSEKP